MTFLFRSGGLKIHGKALDLTAFSQVLGNPCLVAIHMVSEDQSPQINSDGSIDLKLEELEGSAKVR